MRSVTLQLATEYELELQRWEGKERTLDLRFAWFFDFIAQRIHEGVTRFTRDRETNAH